MENQNQKAAARPGRTWPFIDTWVGRITAIIGLIATLGGTVTWWVTRHREHAERQAQLAIAATEVDHGDYPAALQICNQLLKVDPLDRSALDAQLNVAMLWDENFSVSVPEGQSPAEIAAPELDQVLSVLEAGLTRSTGDRAADVQAHLGWAHWLNQQIAEREFGSAAEQDFRAALVSDPKNVYANAMLGDWLLLHRGDVADAARHFDIAVSTGKARPFVRALQVGGFLSRDAAGARAALVQAVNDMRRNGEPLDPDSRRRILNFCFDPLITQAELTESLSAVPSADAWQTYLWLDEGRDQDSDAAATSIKRGFIQASLLEIGGQPQPALLQFQSLQAQLSRRPGFLQDTVNACIARLSHRK
jgi:tetratricopeptide (TPR) repeat protein